ncbi:MAG: acyl-CoA dehydrogenase, partial [Desulfobacterales bacterium]|nr:acyl-CoA dehydrogenase [Desulfobacterales bacterium]
ASLFDKSGIEEDKEEKEKYEDLIEILTPIAKAYCSDRAFEVCSQAVQTFGGYGYTSEYPAEQLLRDCKITSIYEGANGIQAMDLLGRKLGMKKGKPSMDLLGEMKATIAAAKEIPGFEELAAEVDKLGKLGMHMGMTAMSPKVLVAFSFATPFLEVLGDVIMAWMHLWRGALAAPKLKKKVGSMDPAERRKKAEKNRDAAFYEGVVRTAEYFIQTILPITLGKMASIQKSNDAVMEIPEASFGGK